VYRGDPNAEGQRRAESSRDPPLIEVENVESVFGVSESDDWFPKEEMGEDEDVAEEWDSEIEEGSVEEGSVEEHQKEVERDLMEMEDEENRDYMAFIDAFRTKSQDDVEEDLVSISGFREEFNNDLFHRKKLMFHEHIAGPGCKHHGGYHGHRITTQEMRGCKTSQCLVKKETVWWPESDDLDFERESGQFLSGISDHMPSRDLSRPRFIPQRHGLENPNVDSHDWVRH
jgi:hypothetical protein